MSEAEKDFWMRAYLVALAGYIGTRHDAARYAQVEASNAVKALRIAQGEIG